MNSGMVRRIDELGRIVIPKEIRRSLKLNMGDSVEIYVEDTKISLKKHSSLLGLEEELFNIAKVINESTSSTITSLKIGNEIKTNYTIKDVKSCIMSENNVVFAILHIRRQKKKGGKCCGCPYSGSCSGSCSDGKDTK